MIKELSYLRDYVRIEMMLDCRFSESYRMAVLDKMDQGIANIEKGKIRGGP